MSGYKVLRLSGSDPKLESFKNMIFSDFLKSLRYGNEWFKLIDQRSYFDAYEKVISALLAHPDSEVRIAVLGDTPDCALGWSLSEKSKLHFCFVKKDMRNQGIGKSLIPDGIDTLTHLTIIGVAIWPKLLKDAIFNPFA